MSALGVAVELVRRLTLLGDVAARLRDVGGRRNLTREEWKSLVGSRPYRPTCPRS